MNNLHLLFDILVENDESSLLANVGTGKLHEYINGYGTRRHSSTTIRLAADIAIDQQTTHAVLAELLHISIPIMVALVTIEPFFVGAYLQLHVRYQNKKRLFTHP